MSSELDYMPKPTCQAANPSLCSGCNLAYDCGRVRGRRSFSWAIVAMSMMAILAVVAVVANRIA